MSSRRGRRGAQPARRPPKGTRTRDCRIRRGHRGRTGRARGCRGSSRTRRSSCSPEARPVRTRPSARGARASSRPARAALDEALQIPDVPTRSELHERGVQMSGRGDRVARPPSGSGSGVRSCAHCGPKRPNASRSSSRSPRRCATGESRSPTPSNRVHARYAVPPPVVRRRCFLRRLPRIWPLWPSSSGNGPSTSASWRSSRPTWRGSTRSRATTSPGSRATDLAFVLERLLEEYRSGGLLRGRLPMVLDGVLDALVGRGTRRGGAGLRRCGRRADDRRVRRSRGAPERGLRRRHSRTLARTADSPPPPTPARPQ